MSSPLVVALCATALLIAGCLLLTGCGKQQSAATIAPSRIETGSISPAPYRREAVVVRPGDTLHGIARRNHVAVYDLMTFNDLTSTRIAVGQTLYLPPY